MKILVSACLLGENCKYNGKNNLCEKVIEYVKNDEVIPVCPEVLGGMSIPRPSCELSKGRVIDISGNEYTLFFEDGVKQASTIAEQKGVDLAILQSRSPTCGVNQIYDGSFSGKLIEGSGLFAKKLMEMGIKVLDAEEI